jgi:DNA-3-methyladenine glycosylase II
MIITNTHPYVKTLLHQDPSLKTLFDTVSSLSIPFDDDGFHFLMFTITGQQVSAHVANIIFNRLKSLIKSLNAQSLLEIDNEELRSIGLSFSKIHTMKRVATYCIENNFYFNTFLDKNKTDTFISIKGIGPWTMDMYEMFVLKNLNHFSFKDLGLIEGLKHSYLKPLTHIDEIKKVSHLWSPYQSIVAHFLWEYWDVYHKGKRKL